MKYEHDPKELAQALQEIRDTLEGVRRRGSHLEREEAIYACLNITNDALKSAFLKTTRS